MKIVSHDWHLVSGGTKGAKQQNGFKCLTTINNDAPTLSSAKVPHFATTERNYCNMLDYNIFLALDIQKHPKLTILGFQNLIIHSNVFESQFLLKLQFRCLGTSQYMFDLMSLSQRIGKKQFDKAAERSSHIWEVTQLNSHL